MTRSEYTAAVLGALHRMTADEREAIREEIDAHIEDHMEMLLELDYPPELAEERALAAMGDPGEVGRGLDEQHRGWGWVLLGRAAAIMTTVMCVLALLNMGGLGMVFDSISARIDPDEGTNLEKLAATERLDIRIPVGNDILHIYQISVGQSAYDPEKQEAEVLLCAYDRIPGGIVSDHLADGVMLISPRGGSGLHGNGRGNWRVEYRRVYTEILPEDLYVTLHYEAFGEQIHLELPLPGREMP